MPSSLAPFTQTPVGKKSVLEKNPYFCERKELKRLTSRKAFICFCTLLTNRHWMTRLQEETKPHQKNKLISRSQPSVQRLQQPQVLSVSFTTSASSGN